MATASITRRYYPLLSSIISSEDIPEILGFLKGGIQSILDVVHFKDLQYNKSMLGDSGFYSLSIISPERIDFEIPGTGIYLVLNPDLSGGDSTISSFPITVEYQWKVLSFIHNFDFKSFDYNPVDIFSLALQSLNISEENVIECFIDNFVVTYDDNTTLLEQFVIDVNDYLNYSITTPTEQTTINDIIEEIKTQSGNEYCSLIIFPIYLSSTDFNTTWKRLKAFFRYFKVDDIESYIKDILIPKFKATLTLSAGIEFPRKYLTPVYPLGTTLNGEDVSYQEIPIDSSDSYLDNVMFTFGEATFYADTEEGLGYNMDLALSSVTPVQIGKSGVIVNIQNLKLDLSKKTNIAEADADGRPVDFIGVYVDEAEVFLPKKWFSNPTSGELPPGVTSIPVGISIKAKNLLIGTGGISGSVGLEGNDNLYKKIGNFWVGLDNFYINFHQNAIIDSVITGTIIIPRFKDNNGDPLNIEIVCHIGQDGEFSITAKPDKVIPAFVLDGVFSVNVKSLFIGKQSDAEGGKFYIGVSGQIDFDNTSGFGAYLPDTLEVKKMLIYDDGSYEFEHGGFSLPKSFELKLPPVSMSITAIHMGCYEKDDRKYKFFGFDGGVSVNPGGVDARGKGVKLYYTDDGESPFDWFIRLESLNIDIIIPSKSNVDPAVIIKGFLSIKDPNLDGVQEPLLSILKDSTEYAGSVYVGLPKFKGLEVSASMRMIPQVPSFIVDLGIETSTPILLGATGLGIYGIRALFGKKYVATKSSAGVPDDGQWWQYYKAKIAPDYKEGIQVSKFSVKDGFSLGAGVSLATASDSGKVLSTKLFFMLSLPDVFLFQGQAAILKERIKLDAISDPPFFAMIAISSQSIEAGFGANYMLPDEGDKMGSILTVDGVIEMGFFFGNSAAWYLNVGRDAPDNMRIQARVLSLFNMYSYLMLSNSGIKAGAGIGFSLEKEFGPLKAELSAFINLSGQIAFRPKQIGGAFQVGGNVDLSICGLGFSVSAGATLAAEAPKPFIVTGDVYACVKVVGKEYCAKFEFTWNFENDLDTTQVPILAEVDSSNNILIEDAEESACATNITTGETFSVDVLPLAASSVIPAPSQGWIGDITEERYTIPMDSYIDIEFKKPVLVGASDSTNNLNRLGGIASNSVHSELIPPQKGKSTQVRHTYSLDKIEINYFDELSEEWKPYDFYNAMLPMFDSGEVADLIDKTQLSTMKWGYWQQQRPGYNNKLRILATTPLSYAAKTGGEITVEDLGINANTIFCSGYDVSNTCLIYENQDVNRIFARNKLNKYKDVFFKHINHDGIIVNNPYSSIDNGLYIEPGDTLEIYFPERMREVNLLLNSGATSLVIKYYKKTFVRPISINNLPTYDYTLLETKNLTQTDLQEVIEYEATNGDIDFIKIEAGVLENPVIKCIPLNPDINKLGLLFEFINTLAQKGHLAPEGNIVLNSVENIGFYASTYINTELYPNTLSGEDQLILTVKYLSSKSLIVTITDSYGFICKFIYELDGEIEEFSFANISSLSEIIADVNCSQSSTTNVFKLIVTLNDTSQVTLKVRTCITVGDCFCYTENSTILYQICYLTNEEYLQNQSMTSSSQQSVNNNTLIESINKTLQPLWRPNTAYAIRLRTSDKLEEEIDGKFIKTYQNDLVFGFRTAGPIGHFHKFPVTLTDEHTRLQYSELIDKSREDEYKLNTLKHYIDYSKSYPNADGDLLNAKPLFYENAELNVFYLHNYVYEFYNNWVDYEHVVSGEPTPIIANSKLDIIVKDAAEISTVDDPSTTRFRGNKISHSNGATNDPTLPPANINNKHMDVTILNNMLANNSTPCVTTYAQLKPIDLSSSKAIQLKPKKLYTAQFISKYNPRIGNEFKSTDWSSVVHSYVFQTSRYESFNEQVSSYVLNKDESGNITKEAVFFIDAKPIGNPQILDLTSAQSVLTNTVISGEENLRIHYSDLFDRLLNGVLHISIPEPVTTEFNFIKNPLDNAVIGILVQNPEPFNDPKLPKANPVNSSIEEFETLEVKEYNGTSWGTANDFFVIHSKDRSKMFVTKRDFSFNLNTNYKYEFKFKFKLFDGISYSDKATETVEIDLSNYSL